MGQIIKVIMENWNVVVGEGKEEMVALFQLMYCLYHLTYYQATS